VPGSSSLRRPSALHLRLLGGRDPQRFDATVRDEVVEVSTRYANSVAPPNVVVRRAGDTLWLGLPATLTEGRHAALMAGEIMGPNGRPVTTAWRPVSFR
jgi:hypothetical protein